MRPGHGDADFDDPPEEVFSGGVTRSTESGERIEHSDRLYNDGRYQGRRRSGNAEKEEENIVEGRAGREQCE